MTLAFLNVLHPTLLWGAALVAVPLVIHLLNKRRFRIVDWAAMDLLRSVNRQNRRRLRLEDVLLLLLRCLAVLLLALLIARLILTDSAEWARVAGARTERIFILDDSPSMDVRQGNRTTFSQATAALGDYARKLARSRPGDTLTVILTSSPDQPFLNGQVLGGDRDERVVRSLESLPISALPAHFEQTFLSLLQTIAREPVSRRALQVISDFRRHDWLGPESGVPQQLAALAAQVPDLALLNLGQPVASDLAITDVQCDERILTAGVPAPFRLTVVNRGLRDSDAALVTVTVDGAPVERVTLPALAPGAVQTVSVPITVDHAGPVSVEAELTGNDALMMDNRRAYAGVAASAIRVLVVDGDMDPNTASSPSFFLRRALAPPGERLSGIHVEVVDENGFDPTGLEPVQVLCLCNVYRLPEASWRAVADWVHRGGGLVVFPGDQVDGAFWNETARTVAPGLLPVRFEEVAGDRSEREWQTLLVSRSDHPVLQAFVGDRNPFLQRVKVFRYWRIEPLTQPAAVLAAFGNGLPALVESLFGTGHVLVFAMAADATWSNWPSDPSYVVTLQQVARTVARADASEHVLAVGQPLRHEVSPSRYRGMARLFAPQATDAELLQATASTNRAGAVFEYAALRQPGIWNLELTTHEGDPVRVPFAATIAAEESDLDTVEPGALLKRAGHPRIRFITGPKIPDVDGAAGGRTDLTRLLVPLLIGVLLLEQGLAWWFGWRRRAE